MNSHRKGNHSWSYFNGHNFSWKLLCYGVSPGYLGCFFFASLSFLLSHTYSYQKIVLVLCRLQAGPCPPPLSSLLFFFLLLYDEQTNRRILSSLPLGPAPRAKLILVNSPRPRLFLSLSPLLLLLWAIPRASRPPHPLTNCSRHPSLNVQVENRIDTTQNFFLFLFFLLPHQVNL